MLPISKKLDRLIKEAENHLKLHQEAISLLNRSYVIEILRERGKGIIIDGGRDATAQAIQSARSVGYNEALDDLIEFYERVVLPVKPPPRLTPTYGGIDLALKQGDITQEEANKMLEEL